MGKKKEKKERKAPRATLPDLDKKVDLINQKCNTIAAAINELGAVIETIFNLKMIQVDYVNNMRQALAKGKEIENKAKQIAMEEYRKQDGPDKIDYNTLYERAKIKLLKKIEEERQTPNANPQSHNQ